MAAPATTNLNDMMSSPESAAAESSERRRFYLPLASVAPGMPDATATNAVNRNCFTIQDGTSLPSDTPSLVVNIQKPGSAAFQDDGGLPDPAIRLHAVADGLLRYTPATKSLTLELPFRIPGFVAKKAGWFERWIEAECIPDTFTYEGVDDTRLGPLLQSLGLPADFSIASRVSPVYGVSFPDGVTQAAGNRDSFIAQFLAGDANAFLIVAAGAYIGAAASTGASTRSVTFKATYIVPQGSPTRWMNPRELFYLFFGDDSKEAKLHPFLLKMDDIGEANAAVSVKSRTMVLRPPLRTYARVVWEAEQERIDHAQDWAARHGTEEPYEYVRIGPERFIGTRPPFMTGPYPDSDQTPNEHNTWKCNLFVGEICVRSGYRYRVWRDTASGLLYYKAPDPSFKVDLPGMSLPSDIRSNNTYSSGGYVELRNSAGVRWGRRWDLKFLEMLENGKSREDVCDEINDVMMRTEGRCFTLVRSKPGASSGHTMLLVEAVKEGDKSPTWFDADHGLRRIKARKYEAVQSGLLLRTGAENPSLGNVEGTFVTGTELYLLECCPGRDPDSVSGLLDLYCGEGN